jgi:hypothetical protein
MPLLQPPLLLPLLPLLPLICGYPLPRQVVYFNLLFLN